MPSDASGFFIESDTLSSLLVGGDIIIERVQAILEGFAPQVQEDAQVSAPWADRTGLARSSLYAQVTVEGEEVSLDLGQGVDYGYWLEVINNGEYAILMPTLEKWAPAIFEATNATPTGGSDE